MSNSKPNIETGLQIGRLLVGELVRNVQNHELFIETPLAYLQQGRLRECLCDCGYRRLIAESILASGRIRSCGCLRQEIRAKAAEGKVKRMQMKEDKKSIAGQIRVEQARLKALQMQPIHIRDEKAIEASATKIRQLIAFKANLTRKLKTPRVKAS